MKITKAQLTQIIKEELEIHEADAGEVATVMSKIPDDAQRIADLALKEVEKLAQESGLAPELIVQLVAELLTAK
tara:strand:- start:16034 stop:16255 length:222 start_codon:yes stop_codon:yes gene_type:complete